MARLKPVWKNYNERFSASGDRDVLILASLGEVNVDSQDLVPRCSIELTAEHRTKLTNQGIPEGCTDDLSIIKARMALDKQCRLVGEEISEPERELTRDHILGQVENLLKKSDKPGGEAVRLCMLCHAWTISIVYSAFNLSQFSSITLVMVRRTQVTGVSKMGTSPSKTLLSYTIGFAKAMSSLL